jgi:hypothetical protein
MCFWMFQMLFSNVAGIVFECCGISCWAQASGTHVADTWCWVLWRGGRHLMLDVANIHFQYCGCWVLMLQTCDVGLLMFGCFTWHGSQHGHNIVATWGRRGRNTPDVRCCTPCCSQHATHKFATLIPKSLVECCEHDGSQHGKSSSQHFKSCSQHLLRLQRDRRLIRSLIWIVRPRTRPMLAPGSDVRALAALLI